MLLTVKPMRIYLKKKNCISYVLFYLSDWQMQLYLINFLGTICMKNSSYTWIRQNEFYTFKNHPSYLWWFVLSVVIFRNNPIKYVSTSISIQSIVCLCRIAPLNFAIPTCHFKPFVRFSLHKRLIAFSLNRDKNLKLSINTWVHLHTILHFHTSQKTIYIHC